MRRNNESSNVSAGAATAEAESPQPNLKNRGDHASNPAMTTEKTNKPKDNRRRVLLVDDHAVVLFGIAQLINRLADLVVCGEE